MTEAQKKQIESAIHTGRQLVIKPTKTQRGGFLGSLLASIGIPLALKLLGKGLTVPKKAGKGLMVGPKPGMMVPYHPPPFYGSWGSGRGILLGPNSPFNSILILGTIL